MKTTYYSKSTSRCQSSVSKSSNSSISSILRDSSSKRTKKQHSVRFEDSPIVIEKTVHIKLNGIYSQINSPQSPKSQIPKDFKQTNQNEPSNIFRNSPTSGKKNPVKPVLTEETEICEPRFVPQVLNYSFRTSDFYAKLNKFYDKTSEKTSGKGVNCLESEKKGKNPEKSLEQESLIQL